MLTISFIMHKINIYAFPYGLTPPPTPPVVVVVVVVVVVGGGNPSATPPSPLTPEGLRA